MSIQKRKNHYSFVVSCPVSTVFSSRTVYTERTNEQPQSGSRARGSPQEEEDLVVYKAPCEWVVPTMPMMSDYEEDLDDCPTFSAENISRPAETLIGAYRAESTDQWTAASGITTKIPPLFDVSTSCFKYEELIDDWLGLTVLDAGKRGPALKNRLGGDAGDAQGTSQSRISETRRWNQGLQGYSKHRFIKRRSECCPLAILSIYPSMKRKN